MIVDTSALLAVLFEEDDLETYFTAISDADVCMVSAPTFVELCMVIESRTGHFGIRECDSFFRRLDIRIEPFTEEQALAARQAFSLFGKGRHSAGLNLGDCFSYALAKTAGEPLLFKGDDFRKTDIESAI
jgi:ribonuclease VapC